ncbi:MAG: glycosyltransferase family 2 protein [Anaerolineae bacterium]
MTASRAGADLGRITVVILTHNEAPHLQACLESVAWADRVLVVDSGSRDGTRQLAAATGAEVVHHTFGNFSRQRNHALGLVRTPWTFFVDADERTPPALAAEVRSAIRGESAGYWVPRHNVFWGRVVRGGGWWPDHQLRLMATDRAHYDPARAVHEVAIVDGPTGYLTTPLRHLNYGDWGEFRARQGQYAQLEAQRRRAMGLQPRRRSLLSLPVREFWRRYVALAGWRDGSLGLLLALHMAYYELETVRATGASPTAAPPA